MTIAARPRSSGGPKVDNDEITEVLLSSGTQSNEGLVIQLQRCRSASGGMGLMVLTTLGVAGRATSFRSMEAERARHLLGSIGYWV